MIDIIKADGKKEYEFLEKLQLRNQLINKDIEDYVKEILLNVKTNKDKALKEYNLKFDKSDKVEKLNATHFKKAFEKADANYKISLKQCAKNIERFHKKQLKKSFSIVENGNEVGQIVTGLSRVGIYVPGGRAAYPSTVLMNAIPAKIAGVKEIVIFTPAKNRDNLDILAAAYVAGATEMYLVGGAHGIAAAAYGTETIQAVDKIVGPGNIYVATAKKLVYGVCDIDMVAGPSEITIIADGESNKRFIAADLMSQAEHDPLASSVLLTTSEIVANNVKKELEIQVETLERKDTIKESLLNYGAILVFDSMDKIIDIANLIAPEHLEIMTKDPKALLPKIKNAGSVFLGEFSPEPLGDYYAGTNHVLPTNGTARFYSALSVDSFQKKIQYINYSESGLNKAAIHIKNIAGCEGFTAHINSIDVRLK